MKSQGLLHVIYSFFLGLVVVGFVGIGVNTFHPEPRYDGSAAMDAARGSWELSTSILLLVCATLVMAISLVRPDRMPVISNGLLLGGLFTMIYAVGMGVSAERSVARFLVMALALAITIVLGYLSFVRTRRAPGGPVAAAAGTASTDPQLSARVATLEARLEAIGRALRD